MAPRRGGSGGGGYGSGSGDGSSGCPGFLTGNRSIYIGLAVPIEYYVDYALFSFFFLCVTFSLCCLRRKVTQKKLTGPLFLLALVCQVISFVLILLAVTLLECGVIWRNYYDFQIAFTLFFNLANYLLLVIVVWGVNNTLIGRLNSGQSAVKVITLVLSGFMGLLTAALIGLSCYIAWSRTPAGSTVLDSSSSYEKYIDVILSYQRYALAYSVLYLLSVIAAGGLAIATLIRMRSRNILVGDIFFWTVALFVCMLLWVIFQIIPFAASIDDSSNIEPVTYIAIQYLNDFFLLFSYISLIFLSKSRSWEHAHAPQTAYNNTGYDAPAFVPVVKPQQQQYAYNGGQQYVQPVQPVQPGQQNQYYYPQQPAHNGVAAPVNGNGHI